MIHSFQTQKTSSIIRMIGFFVMLIGSVSVFAQDAAKFSVKIKMQAEGGLENALITITKNGSADRVIDPNKSKYMVDLDLNAEYVFTYTKMGCISKAVVFDTHIPSGREKEDFAKFIATVELIKQPEDQVITYTQPVGRIKYSMSSGDFDYDKDYTQTAQEMQKKAEANPTPKPKPPAPNPRPETKTTPPPVTPPSKPIPVEVKQPEYKPEPPKPKPVVVEPVIPSKPIVKNKEEKTLQEDRRKVTIVTVNIDGQDYVYRKEEYNWGGVYFYKDGINITERTYEKETE